MLPKCTERSQWAEFFQIKGHEQYKNEIKILQLIKDSVSKQKRNESWEYLECFLSTPLNFNTFRSERVEMSETFEFWIICEDGMHS